MLSRQFDNTPATAATTQAFYEAVAVVLWTLKRMQSCMGRVSAAEEGRREECLAAAAAVKGRTRCVAGHKRRGEGSACAGWG